MKKLLVLLVFVACNREPVVESTSRPAETTGTTATASTSTAPPSTTRRPDDPTTPKVNGPKLAFIDEASKDPSFAAYREQLVAAVRARDAKTLLALSDPKIRTSFGGDGSAGFVKTPNGWRMNALVAGD